MLESYTAQRISTAVILLATLIPANLCLAQHPFDVRPQPWQRRTKPILSARTTKQAWNRIVVYSPHVIYHDHKFRMWYLGTSDSSRTNDIDLGYAESLDGIKWQPHGDNPILTEKDVPWGIVWQTPFVLFDDDEAVYKMWFVSGAGTERDKAGKVVGMHQHLGYATSRDGIKWNVHPQSLFESGRSPSVIKEAPNKYRMWMGSRPTAEHAWNELYKNVYEFASDDGIHWTRSAKPVLRPSGSIQSTVYPFVVKDHGTYYMWYGGHRAGGMFELFCATSSDGTNWKTHHDKPAFAAAAGRTAFDSRYTSTPCVVKLDDRYLLYYSARDWKTDYIDSEGRKRRDNSSPYSHVGVATIKRKQNDSAK